MLYPCVAMLNACEIAAKQDGFSVIYGDDVTIGVGNVK
jgi:hypothetical protein